MVSGKRVLKSSSSSQYEIYYHLAWCPKYRMPILTEKVLDYLKKAIPIICDSKGWDVHELNIQSDHIHIFLTSSPSESPMAIVKVLKGVTGLRLFKEFPELKKDYWGGHIWSPSYYVGTVGCVTKEVIQKYIALNSSAQHSSGGILEGRT